MLIFNLGHHSLLYLRSIPRFFVQVFRVDGLSKADQALLTMLIANSTEIDSQNNIIIMFDI